MFWRVARYQCCPVRTRCGCIVAAVVALLIAGRCMAETSPHNCLPEQTGWRLPDYSPSLDLLTDTLVEDESTEVGLPQSAIAGLGEVRGQLPVASPLAPVSTADLAGLPNESSAPAVRALPPPPSSLSIALSGLATFGAIRAIRQAKHIHLGAIPEWYHAEAPDRVGAAVRLDLNTDRGLIPACWYEPIVSAVTARYPTCHMRQADDAPRWRSIYFIPTSAPRSPPAGA